jgi:hypothetical protein
MIVNSDLTDAMENSKLTKATSALRRSPEQRVADLMRNLMNSARNFPHCSVEDLWKSNYGMMKKLVSLNPDAVDKLRKKLKKIKPKPAKPKNEPTISPKDNGLAQAIKEEATNLYSSAEKPEKVTLNLLIKGTDWSPYFPSNYVFPKTMQAIEESVESKWHFYARRILWAKLYYKNGSENLIKLKSGVEYHRSAALMEFFRDVDLSTPLQLGTVTKILSERNILLDWLGPCPEREFPPSPRQRYKNR